MTLSVDSIRRSTTVPQIVTSEHIKDPSKKQLNVETQHYHTLSKTVSWI